MYGLEIKVKNIYSKYIYKLFKNVDVQDYVWQINTDDIVIKTEQGNKQGLFGKEIIAGNEFLEIIKNYDYYLIFADCKAFGTTGTINEITNGMDMIENDCDIVFLCTDSTNIDIYCRDKSMYEIIKCNCNDEQIVSVCDIGTEEIVNRNMIAF